MPDRDLDEPVADSIEQHQGAIPDGDEDADDDLEAELPERLPLEADEADAAEQARTVELGEEEYR